MTDCPAARAEGSQKPVQGEVFRAIRRGRPVGLIVLVLVNLLSLMALMTADLRFTAGMLVTFAPELNETQPDMFKNPLLDTLNPGQGSTAFQQFRVLIFSIQLAERLEARHNISRHLFAGQWDADAQAWQQPGLIASVKGALKSIVGLPVFPQPTTGDVRDFIERNVVMRELPNSSVWRLELSFPNRERAADILATIYLETDAMLRESTKQEVEISIGYLKERLESVQSLDHREVLMRLLLKQEQKFMMVSTPLPYGAKTLGDIITPVEPSSPKPIRHILMYFVVSILLGLAVSFLYGAIKLRSALAPQ